MEEEACAWENESRGLRRVLTLEPSSSAWREGVVLVLRHSKRVFGGYEIGQSVTGSLDVLLVEEGDVIFRGRRAVAAIDRGVQTVKSTMSLRPLATEESTVSPQIERVRQHGVLSSVMSRVIAHRDIDRNLSLGAQFFPSQGVVTSQTCPLPLIQYSTGSVCGLLQRTMKSFGLTLVTWLHSDAARIAILHGARSTTLSFH